MEKIKVLVVDDHAIMRDGIRAMLSAVDDVDVVGEASDGRQAVDKVQEMDPDVVVMDISMPDMDGIEATRRIKKKTTKARVLILTQYDNKEYILSAIKAGASGYVPKRALGSDLITAIRAVHKGQSFLYPSAARALIEDYRWQTEGKDPYDNLTPREREILKMIADGHTSREIADKLFVSLKTVLGHRTKIMGKLDLHNRTELIKYAMRKGLTTVDQ
jgi:two-component system response regulator NreC